MDALEYRDYLRFIKDCLLKLSGRNDSVVDSPGRWTVVCSVAETENPIYQPCNSRYYGTRVAVKFSALSMLKGIHNLFRLWFVEFCLSPVSILASVN
ncbi:hypothetical protein NPIL_597351 [Nephila pilipes]|uniref:Uncharacterized protein n=1 Tax=Nephila pilipes TaxID=299642 RepID=A0A8X6UE47_NEPPI|nr:hypothetical protein NPIL_597351 [Nephila pilipes]